MFPQIYDTRWCSYIFVSSENIFCYHKLNFSSTHLTLLFLPVPMFCLALAVCTESQIKFIFFWRFCRPTKKNLCVKHTLCQLTNRTFKWLPICTTNWLQINQNGTHSCGQTIGFRQSAELITVRLKLICINKWKVWHNWNE